LPRSVSLLPPSHLLLFSPSDFPSESSSPLFSSLSSTLIFQYSQRPMFDLSIHQVSIERCGALFLPSGFSLPNRDLPVPFPPCSFPPPSFSRTLFPGYSNLKPPTADFPPSFSCCPRGLSFLLSKSFTKHHVPPPLPPSRLLTSPIQPSLKKYNFTFPSLPHVPGPLPEGFALFCVQPFLPSPSPFFLFYP